MMLRRPPFPGMDPWLEQPFLWPDVHNSLITAIRDALVPLVDPRYFVAVEERLYYWSETDLVLLGEADVAVGTGLAESAPAEPGRSAAQQPGVEVLEVEVPLPEPLTETYLEVRETATGRVVTVIEILSPWNKLHPRGRKKYLKKRLRIFATRTNLVEIDLLRAGRPMPLARLVPPRDYRILVRRGWRRHLSKLYLFSYQTPLPTVPVPLLPGETEPPLELNRIAHDLYDRARYFRRVDYSQPPVPPLRPEDTAWAAAILARASESQT